MKKYAQNVIVCLFIGLCFLWTGTGYLSWLYNLMDMAPNLNAEIHSEVIGYLFQALGLGLFSICVLINKTFSRNKIFAITIILSDLIFTITSITLITPSLILISGYIMNIFHGIVAGIYLTLLTRCLPQQERGLCFGIAYSFGCLGSWLLSLLMDGTFLKTNYSIISIIILVALTIGLITFIKPSIDDKTVNEVSGIIPVHIIVMASILILLFSTIKGLSFYFPMADISNGSVSLEYSRLFYAAGLILAGFIADQSRKAGLITCLAGLIIPFMLIFFINNSGSSLYIWIISYALTGFYTIFRITTFADIAGKDDKLLPLAGMGLLIGRIADALGSFLGIKCNTNSLIMIGSILFVISVIIAVFLYEKLYLVHYNHTVYPKEFIKNDNQTENSQDETLDVNDIVSALNLSKREMEVFELAITEMTNTQISSALYISENTTKFHIRNILKKAGCSNRKELKNKYNN